MGSSLEKGSFARVEAAYRAEGRKMWQAVFLYSHDASIADEAVAEAFAQALRRGDAVREVDKWVWATTFRVARGMLAERSQLYLAGPTVEGTMAASSDAIEMRELVARLPESQRSCIVLYYFADRPVSEVASILGMSNSAVGVHLYRGRKALRRMMGEDADVEP